MSLKSILFYLLIWQMAVVLVTLAAAQWLPIQEAFLGGGAARWRSFPALYSRVNFDGNQYIDISRTGYSYSQPAFFPLFPKLIQMARSWFNPNDEWQIQVSTLVGTGISLICFMAAAVFLVKLVELDNSVAISRLTLAILLLFPVSFFFTAVYTEGVFFLLVVSSWYFARTNRWWWAGALAGLASYTNFGGVFLFPALVIELWQSPGRRHITDFGPLLLAPLGLVGYMYFLQRTTGNPLAFIHFGNHVVMLYQVFWRYAKMLTTVNRSSPSYLAIILEAVTGGLFLVTSIWSFARQRLAYAVFNLITYLIPTLTGSFVSLPRHVLICFPSFILMAVFLSSHRWLRWVYFGVSGALLVIFLGLFSAGYFVA